MGGATEPQLRWNQLKKQGLLGKIKRSFNDVAKDALGLHSTDYWTPYLSAWPRIGDYDASQVFDAVNNGNHLYRRPTFRNTNHMIHIDNLPLILRALGPSLARSMRLAPPIKDLSEKELEERIGEIVGVLKEKSLSINDLKKKLPHSSKQMRWLLLVANGRGLVIRTRGSHAKSNRLDYDLVSRWVKGFKLLEITEEEARTQLVMKYVEHFGPVTLDDFSWWMPCKKTEGKKLVANLGEELSTIKIQGKQHLMSLSDLEEAASLAAPSEPLVSFLPYEDHFPKAFTIRTWYLTEEAKKYLFPRRPEHYRPPEMNPPPSGPPTGMNQSGEIRPSIWVDGKVVGRWEIDLSDGNTVVNIGFVSSVPSRVKKIIEETRENLREFIQFRLVPISGG